MPKKNSGAALVVLSITLPCGERLGAIGVRLTRGWREQPRIQETLGKRTAATHDCSAGAINPALCAQATNLASAIDRLTSGFLGCWRERESSSIRYGEAPLYGKIALVMGNEAEGLARLTLEKCDFLVKLPQAGHIVPQRCPGVHGGHVSSGCARPPFAPPKANSGAPVRNGKATQEIIARHGWL